MNQIELTRMETGQDGTFGIIIIDKKIICFSLEPPWKNNEENISCIPVGQYLYRHYISKTFNRSCLAIENVHKRTSIRMHQGNTVNDTFGCICPGLNIGYLGVNRAVLGSNSAMDDIICLAGKIGNLTIRNGF